MITSPSIVASGLSIRVRVAGTDKKVPSVYQTITIPSRAAIDLSKIKLEGISTRASIKISDFDAVKKPYEYTTDTPKASTTWKKIGKKGIPFKGKNALSNGRKIYIREKGMNANAQKSISLKMPSTIAEITVSGAAADWKKEVYDMTKFDK